MFNRKKLQYRLAMCRNKHPECDSHSTKNLDLYQKTNKKIFQAINELGQMIIESTNKKLMIFEFAN